MIARGLPIILIAEDDLGDRVLLQQAFVATGFKADLRFAADGEEFLAYVRQSPPWEGAERPDLILLDLNMPRMDGREVLREIKSAPEVRAVPVVVLTSSRSEKDVAEAYDRGANTYIPKPDSVQELTAIIQTLCEFWFKIAVLPSTARPWLG
jgi:CheY-like chemotaxis protein